MKKLIYFLCVALLLSSCASKKKIADMDISRDRTTNLEGEKVRVETMTMQGVDEAESLNEEGTKIIKRPFKWYAGIGTADNKQMAIELAQREAYATISRILNNAVVAQSERGNIANNGRVQQALTSYWKQVSVSLQKGCEPYGSVSIEYSPTTKMYTVTAKVAIRGDRFNELMNSAGQYRPEDLTGAELEQFIEVNQSIMEAAKGDL